MFSSERSIGDRGIAEYATGIWNTEPSPVP
jgi:hypothetical protein